jgi:methionyl-tRNA synthetase
MPAILLLETQAIFGEPVQYIEETCPNCVYEDARGDRCGRCGSVDREPVNLKDAPTASICLG